MYGASAVNREIADSCGQRLPEGLWFAPPASTPVFPLAEKGIAAFPDNPVNPVILSKKEIDRITGLTGLTSIIHPFHPVILSKKNPGFTLVELLVALSIFSILMTALVIIFVGALHATQTGYQQMDAFERGRSALNVIEDDLVRSYSSHQSADLRSFYGTPIGMTFVGVTQMTSDPKDVDVNLARITYVVYNQPSGEAFPEGLEVDMLDSNGVAVGRILRDAFPYPLLRYVEPNYSDLESFRIPWDEEPGVSPYNLPVKLRDVLNRSCGQALGLPDPTTFDSTRSDLGNIEQQTVRAKIREIWIRMLAGGDRVVPVDFWTTILPVILGIPPQAGLYRDYIVTDNVLSIVKPYDRGRPPSDIVLACDPRFDPSENPYDRGDDAFGEQLFCLDVTRQSFVRPQPLFDYKAYDRNSSTLVGSPWWNDNRASNWQNPRLPEVVAANFWLMFPSPYPGAPDFQRLFSLDVNLPTGYTRAPEL